MINQENRKDEIEKTLIGIISKCLCIDGSEIAPESNLFNDLSIDDLDFIEILTTIEGLLNIEISESESDVFSSVQSLLDCVENKLQEN